MERIVEAFESGWRAGAALGLAVSADFEMVGRSLQTFWLDGFHTAQTSIGDEADLDGLGYRDGGGTLDTGDAMRDFSHTIGRALHAAYPAESAADGAVVALLARLDGGSGD